MEGWMEGEIKIDERKKNRRDTEATLSTWLSGSRCWSHLEHVAVLCACTCMKVCSKHMDVLNEAAAAGADEIRAAPV